MSRHQTPSQPADVKPFSIRQYVNTSRHKNIFNSWPFPDKYLQMCLNLGLNVNDVLPPFGFQTSSADTLTLRTSIHDVQKKAMKDKQDRRGRKKCKKRSMVDILAVARQCTLEEIHRINKFSYADQQMMLVENIYKSDEAILGGRSEDHEAAKKRGHWC